MEVESDISLRAKRSVEGLLITGFYSSHHFCLLILLPIVVIAEKHVRELNPSGGRCSWRSLRGQTSASPLLLSLVRAARSTKDKLAFLPPRVPLIHFKRRRTGQIRYLRLENNSICITRASSSKPSITEKKVLSQVDIFSLPMA